MAFTLMSVSCIDWARYSLYIKGGTCVIRSLKLNIIGRIPEVWGLYRVSDFPVSAHTHVASTWPVSNWLLHIQYVYYL
jgi:hypothetical protein